MKVFLKVFLLLLVLIPCWMLPAMCAREYDGVVVNFEDGSTYLGRDGKNLDCIFGIPMSTSAVSEVLDITGMTDLDTGSHARVSVPSCRFFELYHVYRSVWDWFMSEHYGYDGFLSLGQQFTYVSAFPRHVDRLWLCDVTWLDDWFDGSLAGLRRSNSFSPTMFDGHDVEDIVYAE